MSSHIGWIQTWKITLLHKKHLTNRRTVSFYSPKRVVVYNTVDFTYLASKSRLALACIMHGFIFCGINENSVGPFIVCGNASS